MSKATEAPGEQVFMTSASAVHYRRYDDRPADMSSYETSVEIRHRDDDRSSTEVLQSKSFSAKKNIACVFLLCM